MPSAGSDGCPPSHQMAIADGHDPDAAGEHPDRRRPQRVAGGLEPDVPGEVQDRGDGDERDDPGIHPRTVPAEVGVALGRGRGSSADRRLGARTAAAGPPRSGSSRAGRPRRVP